MSKLVGSFLLSSPESRKKERSLQKKLKNLESSIKSEIESFWNSKSKTDSVNQNLKVIIKQLDETIDLCEL